MQHALDTPPSKAALTRSEPAPGLAPAERADLAEAVLHLQASRGLLVRGADLLAGFFGSAATAGLRGLKISPALTGKMQGLAEVALRRAFDLAIVGLDRTARFATPRRARLLAAASGAFGGFSGIAGFLPDATFTTLLIMRNIAAIARAEGEDLSTEEARQACLEVFAFGGPALGEEENAEISYWSARLVLQGRPLLMLFSEIGARYGLRISEKFALQAVPLLGAAGGALVNSVFLDQYRCLARVHFTMRRLERRHGPELVRSEAQAIARQLRLHRAAPGAGPIA